APRGDTGGRPGAQPARGGAGSRGRGEAQACSAPAHPPQPAHQRAVLGRDRLRRQERLTPSPTVAMLLCVSREVWGCGGEEAVELSGDVALEAASGFFGGFAFGLSSLGVGAGGGAVAGAGDGDGVEGVVEVSVAGAVEAVSGGVAGGGW